MSSTAATRAIIKSTDMSPEMQQKTVDLAVAAMVGSYSCIIAFSMAKDAFCPSFSDEIPYLTHDYLSISFVSSPH